jgi:tetratricopeptide (TPR) repeat protein
MQSYSLIFGRRISRSNSPLKSLLLAVSIVAVTCTMVVGPGIVLGQQLGPDLQDALDLHRAGRLKDAVEAYTEVLQVNPHSVEALNWRAMAYDDLDDLDRALADLNKAVQLVPNYADAFNNRGEIYRKKKMFREALSDYRRATQLDRNFAEPHYNMGLILEQEKNFPAAINEYSAYLSSKPNAEDRKEVEEKIDSLRKLAAAAKPGPPAEQKAPPQVAKPGEPPEAKPAPRPAPPRARPGVPAPKEAGPPKRPPAPAAVPGMEGVPIPPGVAAVLAGAGMLAVILPLVIYLFYAVMLFLIAKKTATGLPWLAFIPIANVVLMVQIAGKPLWWLALIIVLPIVAAGVTPLGAVDPTDGILVLALSALCGLASVVAYLFVCLGIASARGKSALWGILMFIPCTSPIGWAYLGLTK